MSFIIFHYFNSNGKQTGSSDTTSIVLSENKYAVEAYDRGVEYLMDGNIDDAVMEFKRAIKLDKKFAEAHHQLGLAYLERNTIYWRSRSVLTLKEAVFWDRDDFKIQLDLGKAYLKQI
jgi:tetratricopeptide (TPR) repeat protein